MTLNPNNGIIWTEEKCLELIRKFKANSVLWDTRNTLFYKQDVKFRIWDTIGLELNTTGKACKHKMGILMSSFRREKSRIKKGLTSGMLVSTSNLLPNLKCRLTNHSHQITQ